MKTFLRAFGFGLAALGAGAAAAATANSGVVKIGDVTIYADARFHCAFPSIVCRPDGELLVAFRRAPDRRRLGDAKYTHTDPNSYLMLVRSRDGGQTWSREPELLFANPFGGPQDPCMVQLRDGSIVCTSYGWAWMPDGATAKLPGPLHTNGKFAFLGGYILRSNDGGQSWQPPVFPPP